MNRLIRAGQTADANAIACRVRTTITRVESRHPEERQGRMDKRTRGH